MGLKKKLMMQATAAAAAADAGADGESTQVWTAGDDPLWSIHCEVAPKGADLDLAFLAVEEAAAADPAAKPAPGGDGGAAAAPAKYKWATSLDSQFVFDFKRATPKQDVAAMCWGKDVVGVMRSDAGAEGVFFVQTSSGAVVLKGSRSMGPEVFSSLLGTALGVYCPPWRVIATGSPEGKELVAELAAKDASGRLKLNLGSLTHVLLKGFLPGGHLGEIGSERAAEIFGRAGLSDNGCARLREIGRILALDVLCNNGDRFPLIWDNRGNPGNVMMARGVGKAVSIDSQIQPIDAVQHRVHFEAYLDKVRELVESLKAKGDGEELPQFKRVRDKLLEFTAHDVGTAGTIEMQKGFLEVSANKDAFGITKDRLSKWRDAVASYDPPLVGLAGCDPDFVLAVWELF
mmetsp:Transcript_23442/g.61391  ORF Transcript_23442/g.61391 Transcript_23442/m.61391 type:complete len:403 (+) Transcript_23442:63-1271(+)